MCSPDQPEMTSVALEDVWVHEVCARVGPSDLVRLSQTCRFRKAPSCNHHSQSHRLLSVFNFNPPHQNSVRDIRAIDVSGAGGAATLHTRSRG